MTIKDKLKRIQQVRLEIIRSLDYIQNNNIIKESNQNFIYKYFNKELIKKNNYKNDININFFKNYFDLLGYYYTYERSFGCLYSGYFQTCLKESINILNENENLDFINHIPKEIIDIINTNYEKEELLIKNEEINKKNIEIDKEYKNKSFLIFLNFLVGKQIGCINRSLINENLKNKTENLIFLSERTLNLMDFIESDSYEYILKEYKNFYQEQFLLIDKNDKKKVINSLSLINGYYNFYDIYNRINQEYEKNKAKI